MPQQDIFHQLAAESKAKPAPSDIFHQLASEQAAKKPQTTPDKVSKVTAPLDRPLGPTELKPGTDATTRARQAYFGNHHWWTVAAIPFLGNAGAALDESLKDAQGLTQEGRREHPAQAVVGDVTKQAQELNRIVGPEVNLLSAPAALEEAPNIVRNIYKAARDPAAVKGAVEGIFNSLHPRVGRAGVAAQKMQRDIELVAPDLAQISRDTPLGKATLMERVKGRGEPGWFSEAATRIDDYKSRLWEQGHKAPVDRHAAMPFDSGKVLRETLAEIHPEDDTNQSRMAVAWAQREIPKLQTVKSADNKIRLLNADIRALPEKYGPVGARVRMKALSSIRNQLDNHLVEAGETGVRDINRRWGALNAVEGRMRERYFQETGKIAGKSPLPDWMHAYVFGHPGGAAYGIGIRASRMFMPDDALSMRAAMEKLGKSGLRPEPIFTPEYVGKRPIGLLPAPGETYTDLGKRAPGGPRTRRHPIEVHGIPED